MTTDPWQHMLHQLEPAYDKYKDIAEYGQPKFMIDLTPDIKGKFQILIYTVFLFIVSILPFVFQFVGLLSTLACIICGLALLLQAYNFYL